TQSLIAHYHEEWLRLRQPKDGGGPTIGPRNAKRARELVERLDFDGAKAMVDRFLADTDHYLVKRGHALYLLDDARLDGYRTSGSKGAVSRNGYTPPATDAAFTPGRVDLKAIQ